MARERRDGQMKMSGGPGRGGGHARAGAKLGQTSPARTEAEEIRCQICRVERAPRSSESTGAGGHAPMMAAPLYDMILIFVTLSDSGAAPPARASLATEAHCALCSKLNCETGEGDESSHADEAFGRLRFFRAQRRALRQRERAGESSARVARASSASHPSPGIDRIDHGPLRAHGHGQVGDAEGAARRHPAAGGHPRARRGRRHHRHHLVRHAASRVRVQVAGGEALRGACCRSIRSTLWSLTALVAASRARFRRDPSAGRHFFPPAKPNNKPRLTAPRSPRSRRPTWCRYPSTPLPR